jgi:hypothetical protein
MPRNPAAFKISWKCEVDHMGFGVSQAMVGAELMRRSGNSREVRIRLPPREGQELASMAEKITRDVLESHLACSYKCHLKLAGQQGSKSNYESWLTDLRVREKAGSIADLIAHHGERGIIREIPLVVSTLKTGPAVILDGTFENERFSLRFDGLIKVQGPSDLGQFHYVPVLFHEGQIQATQRVLVELFSLVLQELQGRAPRLLSFGAARTRPRRSAYRLT